MWEAQQQCGGPSFDAVWPIAPTASRRGTVSLKPRIFFLPLEPLLSVHQVVGGKQIIHQVIHS